MRMPLHLFQLVLLAGTLALCAFSLLAQDADLVRHFDYDNQAPLGVKELGVERRGDVSVYNITYASPKGGLVPAYLVVPKGKGPFAAVIWGHWYWQNSPMRNRKQFLDEAVVLAGAGVVSLLTDGPVAHPKRLAYVGHSYNAGVGGILAGVERRFKAFVLMAGGLSDEVNAKTPQYQDFRQKVGPEKLDAFVAKYYYLDQGKFVSHAAPAVVFLQYATQETFLTPELARHYAAIVSEPKRFKLYEAPHALNAEARRDRIAFLAEQLKLKPLSAAVIASIPDLYQPPAPN